MCRARMRVTPRVALFALALACAASAPSSASPPPAGPPRRRDDGRARDAPRRGRGIGAGKVRAHPDERRGRRAPLPRGRRAASHERRGDSVRSRRCRARASALRARGRARPDARGRGAEPRARALRGCRRTARRAGAGARRGEAPTGPREEPPPPRQRPPEARAGRGGAPQVRDRGDARRGIPRRGRARGDAPPRRAARAGDVETVLLEEEEGDRREYSIETLSVTPRVFLVRGFLSAAERAHLVDVANRSGAMAPSRVAGPDEGSARTNADEKTKSDADSNPDPNRSRSNSMTRPARVSTTAWIPAAGDAVVEAVTRRAHALVDPTFLDAEKDKEKNAQKTRLVSERVQVLRYSRGGYFHVHHESTAFLRRFATVLYYLDGPGPGNGGHTAFPLAPDGAGGFASDATGVGYESVKRAIESRNVSEACGVGVAVEPTPGAAVLFYNFDESGRVDSSAVHAACEVTGEGAVKWAANHWFNLVEEAGARAREEGRGAGGAGTDGVDERGTSGRDELR